MGTKYYIRIENNNFGFVVDDIHTIDEATDHEVTQEEYDKFFELQSEGKQLRLKEVATGERLFDLIEEYTPEPLPPASLSEAELLKEEVLNQSEMMLEMDFRMTSVELGL